MVCATGSPKKTTKTHAKGVIVQSSALICGESR